MSRISIIYISVVIAITAVIFYAAAREHPGFKEKMIQFLDKTAGNGNSAESTRSGSTVFLPTDDYNQIFFNKGDWSEYVTNQENNYFLERFKEGNIYTGENVKINATGSIKINAKYGKSFYTDKKYRQYDEDKPQSRIINTGFWHGQSTMLNMNGTVGDRITIFIDHDSKRDDNDYVMNYRALSDEEVIREINAGEIDIKFNHSKYAVFDNTDSKGLGVDFTVGKGDFSLKAFGSVAKGETAVEYFKGNSSPGETKVADYQYIRSTYYQLEPFKKYDNVNALPSGVSAYSLVAVTSKPPYPASYTPVPVNISPTGFELYIDDQNPYNNYNAIRLPLDGGFYTKMVNGSDYSINFSTGIIHFQRQFPENSRIFAVYNRSGGTLDPCALSPDDSHHPGGTFSGKIFVFIKYGYSLDEDTVNKNLVFDSGETDRNFDGKVNIDIYEIRSAYYLGAKQILASNFSLKFYDENRIMTDSDKEKLSRYKLDLTGGTLLFSTRESFRSLFSSDRASKIYSETKNSDAYIYSRYRMVSEYNVESRNFRLKHGNVIEKSVRIRVNEKDIPASSYSVDYESGYITFSDPNNPVISSDSRIEVKYEFLPFGAKNENFIGGIRTDYDINKSLRVGGTVMISKNGESETIPEIGKEKDQTLLFEGDTSLKLSPKRLADLYNIFAERKKKIIPAEFSAYAEYAKSFKDVNTFGKALIDNIESSDDSITVSLSEKDWILSSMPATYLQSDRGILNYYFYRDPNSSETLNGEWFNPTLVNYSIKPGPFNIACGHIPEIITGQALQKSLVFDFNASGTVVTAVTNRLLDSALDFSGMQYIEVWVKYEGISSVDLWLDLGTVNEDSDNDMVLDTEDVNNNGYIDSEPSTGYSEDRGYVFNPQGGTATKVGSGPGLSGSTLGDGILNSEDLNNNGILDTTENIYSVNFGFINPSPGVWQQKRFYMDWSSIPSDQRERVEQALSDTRSIRLYLKKGNSTSGRLFINALKVISSKWKNPELNGILTDNPNIIKVTLLNNINDDEYRNESFFIRQSGVYESLYGKDSTNDLFSESETALQIDYNIPSAPPDNQKVSVKRKFNKDIDIRFYKTLNFWLNVRNPVSSNVIGFVIGSSDNDFIEYRVKPDFNMLWREVQLKLSDDSKGYVEKYQTIGNPDMKRIKYIKVIIYGSGTAGTIWLDEIYVSEPEKLEGDAHWYEFELKTLKPLFKTDNGTAVLSDINLRFISKGHSKQFNTVNKTSSDIKENYHEVFTSAKILPNWGTSIDYINESSSTDSMNEEVPDSKKGDSDRNFFTLNSTFISPGSSIPSITLAYSFDKNKNSREAETLGTKYVEDTVKTVHTPVIIYKQELADFLYGRFTMKMVLDMIFSHSRVNRDSLLVENSLIEFPLSPKESEKKQESDVKIEADYANSLFYFRPRFNTGSREFVELQGTDNYDVTGVNGVVNGSFHLPFSNTENLRYIERNNGTGTAVGMNILGYLSPEYSINIDYKENGFKDYKDELALCEGFSRYKNSMSNLNTAVKVPVSFRKTEIFERIRHMQFNYSRTIYFDEREVPYEGEGTDFFNEKYGLSNILSGFSSPVFNLFNKYPGFYFAGRGNYGNGRDLIYRKLNDDQGIKGIALSSEYNNSLKLMDTFTSDLSVDAVLFKVYLSGGLSQVCERSNIYGIPNQIVIADGKVNIEFDLMNIFNFWFFRKNGEGLSYHSSVINFGLNYTNSMLITYNINEKKISPSLELTFKWDRSSLGFKYEFDYREKKNKDYISTNIGMDDSDYIYLMNMEGNNEFSEQDFGHRFSSIYETDIGWLYSFFSNFYKLTGIPVFSVEYKMEINRYDYFKTVSPEPYDLQMITTNLNLDLHKNIQGGISGKVALEKYRNRENNGISREVRSYEIGGSITFIF